MSALTTRRRLLGAAAALPIAAITTVAAAAGAAADRSEWERLCADHQRSLQAYRPLAEEHNRRETQQLKAMAAMRPAPEAPSTGPIDKSLSLAAILAQATTPEHNEEWRQYEVAREVWVAERAALAASVMGEVETRFDAALDRRSETIAAIREYPVTDLGMLIEKVDLLEREFDGEMEPHEWRAVTADLRRLVGNGDQAGAAA